MLTRLLNHLFMQQQLTQMPIMMQPQLHQLMLLLSQIQLIVTLLHIHQPMHSLKLIQHIQMLSSTHQLTRNLKLIQRTLMLFPILNQ
ncbi:MAG: hypothetical protein EBZ14_10155 [Gammaproteobacteria bacterium]|nr:hypothetical protein [Gammaproteobacteria bacterium]